MIATSIVRAYYWRLLDERCDCVHEGCACSVTEQLGRSGFRCQSMARSNQKPTKEAVWERKQCTWKEKNTAPDEKLRGKSCKEHRRRQVRWGETQRALRSFRFAMRSSNPEQCGYALHNVAKGARSNVEMLVTQEEDVAWKQQGAICHNKSRKTHGCLSWKPTKMCEKHKKQMNENLQKTVEEVIRIREAVTVASTEKKAQIKLALCEPEHRSGSRSCSKVCMCRKLRTTRSYLAPPALFGEHAPLVRPHARLRPNAMI